MIYFSRNKNGCDSVICDHFLQGGELTCHYTGGNDHYWVCPPQCVGMRERRRRREREESEEREKDTERYKDTLPSLLGGGRTRWPLV